MHGNNAAYFYLMIATKTHALSCISSGDNDMNGMAADIFFFMVALRTYTFCNAC